MISLGPRLLFAFPPSTSSRAENQQQPRSQGNHLSAPCGIIYSADHDTMLSLLIKAFGPWAFTFYQTVFSSYFQKRSGQNI